MIELPAVVGVIGTLLVIASALGAIAATFRTATLRSTISDQQASNSALRERVEVAEAEISKLEAEVGGLRAMNREMAATLTGASQLADIAHAQVNFAEASDRRHKEIVAMLVDLRRP
jgi:cell division protein FtsB